MFYPRLPSEDPCKLCTVLVLMYSWWSIPCNNLFGHIPPSRHPPSFPFPFTEVGIEPSSDKDSPGTAAPASIGVKVLVKQHQLPPVRKERQRS